MNGHGQVIRLTTRPVVGASTNDGSRNGDRDAQLAAIVMASNDAIISVGIDLIVRTWNPGAAALFGYSEAEVLGGSNFDTHYP